MGYNLKPLDLQGAVGSVQLLKFDEIHRLRRQNKERIQKIVETIPGVRVVNEKPQAETSWFGVPIICETSKLKRSLVDLTLKRTKYRQETILRGIFCSILDISILMMRLSILKQIKS